MGKEGLAWGVEERIGGGGGGGMKGEIILMNHDSNNKMEREKHEAIKLDTLISVQGHAQVMLLFFPRTAIQPYYDYKLE